MEVIVLVVRIEVSTTSTTVSNLASLFIPFEYFFVFPF